MRLSIPLLIGVGNEYRSDDRAGREIVRRIAAMKLNGIRTMETGGEGAALMDLLDQAHRVYVFDAALSGADPGTIHRIEAHHELVPSRFFHYSTHAFSVAEGIEMARAMGRLPERLILFGIEGRRFEHGTTLSEPVEKAVGVVITMVLRELTV
jgi:hydrogenase maturation protease